MSFSRLTPEYHCSPQPMPPKRLYEDLEPRAGGGVEEIVIKAEGFFLSPKHLDHLLGANVSRFWRPTASTPLRDHSPDLLPSAVEPPGVQRRGCILSLLRMQPSRSSLIVYRVYSEYNTSLGPTGPSLLCSIIDRSILHPPSSILPSAKSHPPFCNSTVLPYKSHPRDSTIASTSALRLTTSSNSSTVTPTPTIKSSTSKCSS